MEQSNPRSENDAQWFRGLVSHLILLRLHWFSQGPSTFLSQSRCEEDSVTPRFSPLFRGFERGRFRPRSGGCGKECVGVGGSYGGLCR